MGKFLAFLFALLLGIPVALLRGVVLSDMFRWYTPFQIGVVQAIGISFIVGMFLAGIQREKYARDEGDNIANLYGALISGVLTTLVFWLFAYLWSFFL